MTDTEAVLEEVRRSLRSEPRIDLDRQSIHLAFANGELMISGEVEDIAAKRLAVQRAARAALVAVVLDELLVRPGEAMPDREIRDLLSGALVREAALAGCEIRENRKGRYETARAPVTKVGRIDVRIKNGVVTLDGEVSTLAQKRIAGVLAWWVPGTRDVVNNLAVLPSEADSDEAMTNAARLALDNDPAIHATAIQVGARGPVISLEGTVPTPAERSAAERDAWYVFGVEEVLNKLEVRR